MQIRLTTSLSYWMLVTSYLQVIVVKGFDHHKRHHHDEHNRHRGQHPHHTNQGRKEWDQHSHLSSVADDGDLFDWPFDLSTGSTIMNDDDNQQPSGTFLEGVKTEKTETSFDETGQAHRFETLSKESRNNFYVAPVGSDRLLSSKGVFSNNSHGAFQMAYSEQTVFADGQIYDSDESANMDPENPDKEPVPAASIARSQSTFANNDDINNNYISNSRWTLKYKGMPSEQELNNTRVNITAKLGGSAFLPCRVGHLGDRQISWIRRRDWHVLTSGRILYTHDQRFSVLHEPGSQDWTLHIKWVNMRDAGAYECQVSTGTGIISLFVKLSVVIPEAYIPGDGQYHVDKGSAISLSCYIRNSPAPPQYILWHHNAELLNFLRDRPDIKISDDLHKRRNQFGFHYPLANGIDSGFTENMKGNEDMSISRLQVPFADDIHSGNYTCSAPNTQSASTLVFITEGDKTAAVQRIDSGAIQSCIEIGFILMSVFISVLFLS